jgi:hypothetical protein
VCKSFKLKMKMEENADYGRKWQRKDNDKSGKEKIKQ